jgi:hypothetical protein
MRRFVLLPLICSVLVAAKGADAKEEAPPAPAATNAAPAPEAAPAPATVKNISMGAALAFGDGTSKSGRVQGVERTTDAYDQEWSTETKHLVLEVEVGTTEIAVPWTQVKSLTITPAAMTDVSCDYTSDTTPWTYACTLPTTSAVVLKDGKKGNVVTRKRWRFSYEDGSTVEFYAHKLKVSAPDDRELGYGDDPGENAALYAKLQQKMRADVKGRFVKSVTITP